MIIVKLSGGLGNQMFQYARGRTEAEKRNTTLKLDLSAYRKSKKRSYLLDRFRTRAERATWFEILWTKYISPRNYLEGDFQSEIYFTEIEQTIRRELTLKESVENTLPDIANTISGTNSVSVHVRRTDYQDKQHRYILLTPSYYAEAMDIMSARVPDVVFFFFSDDIEWMKENIDTGTHHVVFVSDAKYTDYQELSLMSMSKHTIIANSTFSWWAAWLNPNKDKIVIAPKNWFSNGPTPDALLPKTWQQI